MDKKNLVAIVLIAALLYPTALRAQGSNQRVDGTTTCTAPEFVSPPTSLTSSHCQSFDYTFVAQNSGESPIFYRMVSGPGVIDSITGQWTYHPSLTDVGAGLQLVVEACDTCAGCGTPATVGLTVTNQAPQISCPTIVKLVQEGDTAHVQVSATDDCDPIHYSLGVVFGNVDGQVWVNSNTGEVFVLLPSGSATWNFTAQVYASDGRDSTECEVPFNNVTGCSYGLKIASVHNTVQGHQARLPVTLMRGDSHNGLGSFNILLGYDAAALAVQGSELGEAFGPSGCGWEYFTYRYSDNSGNGTEFPTGLIRLIGAADDGIGESHPSCELPSNLPQVLFYLEFLVSNNIRFSCLYEPVRFYWTDCGDNTLSNRTGSEVYLSCTVAENETPLLNIQDVSVGFPTDLGAQSECDIPQPGSPYPVRNVNFIDGGFDLACCDCVSSRGDINVNGFAYEVADVVMYMNYFVYGVGVFAPHIDASIAASDVNLDGVGLSPADLVYIIRIILGDAPPLAKPVPVMGSYAFQNGILSVPDEMGALFAVVKGNVTPQLLATNMEMGYAFDGTNTRILVYPNFENASRMNTFEGDVLRFDGEIVSVAMATPDGAAVISGRAPSSFALEQNYPNPFNPTTEIQFSLANSSDVTLDIFNITGQHVRRLVSGSLQAGTHKVEWDGTADDGASVASGIYMYRLRAGEYVSSKKMILIR
jgi:hypothetical protein